MKGLSLRQPWAWAVVHAGKTIENRRWNTSFRGLRTARGTVWGAYNAVTAYLTHERGKDQERRLDESWFGAGAMLNRDAYRKAVELAHAA